MMAFELKQVFFESAHLVKRGYLLMRNDPSRATLAIRMAAWVLFISAMAKVLSLPQLLSIITPSNRVESTGMKPNTSYLKLSQLTDRLLNLNVFVLTPTCWKRAMVLYRYLALNGIETRIVFGITKREDSLLAGHAWLEFDGKPFLESKNPEFTVT